MLTATHDPSGHHILICPDEITNCERQRRRQRQQPYTRAGDLRQVRYVGAAAGYLGPSELSAHFGLGAAPVVDELQVHWADGSTSTHHQVPTNRTLTITAR